MKTPIQNPRRRFLPLACVGLLTLLVHLGVTDAHAVITRWKGTADNWSTAASWLTTVPTFGDDVMFGNLDNTGTPGPSGTINNIVDSSKSIRSLRYTNFTQTATGFHTTEIPTGVTLSVTGAVSSVSLFVGTTTEAASDATNYTTIRGAGTLLVSNVAGIVSIRQGHNTSGPHRATLDLSGLDTFLCVASQVLVAADGASGTTGLNRPAGTLILAKTNIIVSATTTANLAIRVGNSSGNANSTATGLNGILWLGQTNLILNDVGITVGNVKSSGELKFNPNISNPIAVFRNIAGTGRQGSWLIGHNDTTGTATTTTGNVDFTGGTVDAMVTTIYVGRGQQNPPDTGEGRGNLALNKGVIDTSSMEIAQRRENLGGVSRGTVTVGDTAQLIISGSTFRFGLDRTIDATSLPCSGTLNITNGGFVWAKGNVIDGGFGTNFINITSGHLKVGGQLGRDLSATDRPFDEVNLTNATLTLTLNSAINNTNPVCSLTNLNIASGLTLNLQGGGFTLGQYPLIKYYSGFIGGDGYPVITLASLPSRTQGYLSNNVAASSIDFVVTNISAAKWDGTVNGDWDINTTANWIDLLTSGATTYLEDSPPGDSVIFDDTATGTTTVSLATNVTLSPALIQITNSSKTYIFNGDGKFSGTGPLSKNGNGLVIITNSGVNDFSGAISINDGVVRLGLSSNRLPVSANVTFADVAGAKLELADQDQTLLTINGGGSNGGEVNLGTASLTLGGSCTYLGTISGTGALRKNNGTLNLGGANTYSGGTFITGGTTTLINPTGSGVGTGPVTVASGLTFNVGNGGSGGLAATVNITNAGTLNFNATNDTALAGIHGAGTVSKVNSNIVTITGPSTFTGALTISGGAIRLAHGDGLGSSSVVTTIDNIGDDRVELTGDITVPKNFSLQMKDGSMPDVAHFVNVSGTNTLTGTVTGVAGGTYWTFRSDAGRLIFNGTFVNNGSSSRYIRLTGASDGDWLTPINNGPAGSAGTRLLKDGTGTWTLAAINTYTNVTMVRQGRLLVTGQVQSPNSFTVGDFEADVVGTLGGTGIIKSAVKVDTNGILAPGLSIGTLTITSNLTMVAGSTNLFDLQTDTLEHDLVTGVSNVTYGGTLVLNLSGADTALTNGATVKLFDAASYSGAFAAIVPATPGPCQAWDTTQLTVNGTLGVVTYTLTANTVTYQRPAGTALKIYYSQLLTNVTSTAPLFTPAISLQGVGINGYDLTSTNGATLTTNATFIGYTNSVTPGVVDSFNYVVATPGGCSVMGTIVIQPVAASTVTESITIEGGSVHVAFSGIPGYEYTVERAENVGFTVNVVTMVVTNAPANGQFGIIDSNPPSPTAFYRLKYNP